ncbi:membrane protein [Bacteroidia bacterium]|nr:membrane protein [Bacteroidia bacterium]
MKMKKCFKFFSVAAIVAAGLVGCSSETPVNPDGNGSASNELTAATFTFPDFKSTKADLVSESGETSTITTIRILVYKDVISNNGVCEADTTISGGNPSATVLVTSGWKRILVIANDRTAATPPTPPSAKAFTITNQKGQTLDKLVASKTYNSGTTYLNETIFGAPAVGSGPLTGLDYAEMSGPINFIFSNSLADSSSRKELLPGISSSTSASGGPNDPTKNHFQLYVKRSVAKVTVYTTASAGVTAVPVLDNKGTLSNLNWGVRNQNRGIAQIQIPTLSGKPQAPFFNELDAKNTAEMAAVATYRPFWWTGDALGDELKIALPATTPGSYYYIPENANNRSVRGNTTYTAIKATFTPTANTVISAFKSDNGLHAVTEVTKASSVAAPGTFYRVIGVAGTNGSTDINTYGKGFITDGNLYTTLALAMRMAYIAEHNGDDDGTVNGYPAGYVPTTVSVDTYTNGICYYRLNIGDNTNSYVVRNNQYRVNISAFNTIGEPNLSDLDKDPGKPIDEPTYVTATIQILDWDTINQVSPV